MRDAEAENHREERPGGSYSEVATELLNWQEKGFEGGNEKMIGRDEIKSVFSPTENELADPEKLSRVIRFITSKMNKAEVSAVQARLDSRVGMSSIPAPANTVTTSPGEVLASVLRGDENERIDTSNYMDRRDVTVLALYLYANTSGHSEGEMTEVLGNLVASFDDPDRSDYEHFEGLGATPFLARLCRKTIEAHELQDGVRGQIEEVLRKVEGEGKEMRLGIGRENAYRAGVPLEGYGA